ncbi:GMC oxidoreductase [Amniculicola lignicola CBS 123094]|uniref:GMC oxidoreductase n=1 Tax=Amniculicola lignicola CBS 123094 TaxID=1392246 RepID=A0A6A5WMM6_9PLEO|nr:GMC oxidoreductase [Amniculicola lignicola CBS 123094]
MLGRFTSIAVAAYGLVTATAAGAQRIQSGVSTKASFDYVVIGGGTAGLVVASRLAEFASVAVIEAGGLYEVDNGNASTVPYLGITMPFLAADENYTPNSLMDWDLLSTPQVAAGNRRVHYAQGKTLGGSSAINSIGYHRATKGAYKRWADLVNDQSYTFDRILPYFKRSCALTPPDPKRRNAPNATVKFDPFACGNTPDNPLQVSWSHFVDAARTWLALALPAIGQPLSSKGFNGGELKGGAWIPGTVDAKDSTRSTSKNSYLRRILEKKKAQITIYLHSRATKIVFNDSKRATGVVVSSAQGEHVISAKKEVILSAGVFLSPQLLMLSGIGPAKTLSDFSINITSDLPGVGQNLWDQIFVGVTHGISPPASGAYLVSPEQKAIALEQYNANGTGPYSTGTGYMSFEKLPAQYRTNFSPRTATLLSQFPADWPEIENVPVGFPGGAFGVTTVGALSAILQTPSSRGNVTIRSANIADAPVINLGWLTDEADGEILVAALKRVREAWASPALANITVGPELFPGSAVTSDAAILNYIKNNAASIWHASATCKMGKAGDRSAVVDSKARVFGVKGLRVVDNSIPPFSLPGHPQASVYMLAEKIADDILKGR